MISFQCPRARAIAPVMVIVVASIFSSWANGQVAELVTDLTPGLEAASARWWNQGVVDTPSFSYLQLTNRGSGSVLWTTEGTPESTYPIMDLNKFWDLALDEDNPTTASAGNSLFFVASRFSRGEELWTTDGTPSGGHRVTRDVLRWDPWLVSFDAGVFYPEELFGNTLRWTDGSAGTSRLIWPSLITTDPVVFEDRLFFFGNDPSGVAQLLSTTHEIGSVEVIADVDSPWAIATGLDKLYFVAGQEFWTSDGSGPGTYPLMDLGEETREISGPLSAQPNTGAYLALHSWELGWQFFYSDGTVEGTLQLDSHASAPSLFWCDSGALDCAAPLESGRLVFLSDDSYPDQALWSVATTPGSFQKLAGPGTGIDLRYLSYRSVLVTNHEVVVFVAADKKTLWSTDGTPSGTIPFLSVESSSGTWIESVVASNGKFIVIVKHPDSIYEIFRSDGTPSGTWSLWRGWNGFEDPALDGGVAMQDGKWILPIGPDLFAVPDVPSPELELLWSDRQITRAASNPIPALDWHDRLLFAACRDTIGSELWLASDSGEHLTKLMDWVPCVRNFDAPGDTLEVEALHNESSSLAFLRGKGHNDVTQMLATDGSPEGSVLLAEFGYAEEVQGPFMLDGFAWWLVNGVSGSELWRSDGSSPVSEPFASLGSPRFAEVQSMSIGFGGLLLAGRSPEGKGVLWLADSNLEEFTLLLDDDAGQVDFLGAQFLPVGNEVFFTLSRNRDYEVWRTGSEARSARPASTSSAACWIDFLSLFQGSPLWIEDDCSGFSIRRWVNGVVSDAHTSTHYFSWKSGVTLTDELIFFAIERFDFGLDLWVSDGTDEGTLAVGTSTGESISPVPGTLEAVGDRLLFAGHDEAQGAELWESDGTSEGTRLVHDIAPLAFSSHPLKGMESGDQYFFSADDHAVGRELWALPLETQSETCSPSDHALCLQGERFRLEAVWEDFTHRSGRANVHALTADTGYFWFFDPDNVEVMIKVLDGQAINDHFWTFYGALSNVGYSITLTDTETGATRRYSNPVSTFSSVADVETFGPRGADVNSATSSSVTTSIGFIGTRSQSRVAMTSCEATATRHCLLGGRFAVEISWRDFSNNTGIGQAVELTDDTGSFWFFNPDNLELVVKVLDGRPVNDHFWVFYGALSTVEYELTVTDTATGAVRTYFNPAHNLASVGDTEAFPGTPPEE